MAEADRKMRIKLNDPNWKRPEGYVWNHAGEPGDGPKQMELVESRKGWRHGAVAHTGSASVPRAAARGVVVKGIAIIDAYLTLKEAFEMGSEKGTEVDWRAAVFADENGDMFKLEIPNLLSSMFYSPRITYIAGERDGEEVEISSDEADKLVDTYYALFGRFVKGSWGFPDRFIPGDVRTVLPAIRIHADGSVEEGYIDETGPHFEKGIEQVFRDLTNELSM